MWLLKIRKLVKAAGREALILLLAIRHPDTPLPLKVAATAALGYLFSPLDLLPDLPVIGWVDDLLLLSYGLPYLIRRLPSDVLAEVEAQADRILALFGAGASMPPKPAGRASPTRAPRKRPARAAGKVSDAKIVSPEKPARPARRGRSG